MELVVLRGLINTNIHVQTIRICTCTMYCARQIVPPLYRPGFASIVVDVVSISSSSQLRIRSPRHSMVGLPTAVSSSSGNPFLSDPSTNTTLPLPCVQLASTRIPLRSALFHLSEWWPLIPTEVNYLPQPPPLQPQPKQQHQLPIRSEEDYGREVPPSPAPAPPATAPPVFFHKAPSMDHIGM